MLTRQPALGHMEAHSYESLNSPNRTSSFEQRMLLTTSSAAYPFTSLDLERESLLAAQQLQIATAGYETAETLSPISPMSSPRPILGSSYNGWNTTPLLQNRSPRLSSSDSEGSSFSSLELTDIMNSLTLSPSRQILSSPTDQELINLRALYSLAANSALSSVPTPPSPSLLQSPSLENRYCHTNENLDPFGRTLNLHTNLADCYTETTITWSGELPRRIVINPTFSCKVFLGGVPWDVTEDAIFSVFKEFGKIRIEWPGKEGTESQSKGYVYIIFESESKVKALLNSCAREICGHYEQWYFRISSRKMKSKEVQVIPWRLADSNYVQVPTQKLDPQTTVFVGALHGMMNAEGLFKVMDDLFGGVIYVGIDTDKFKYPIGSARVTFNNKHSYIKAVLSEFIEIKTNRFSKKVQIDPYLEDSVCSNCVIQQGPYFCRELSCYRYFCHSCWMEQHQSELLGGHKPLVRTSKHQSKTSPVKRAQSSK